MNIGFGLPSEQNRAHHEDLTWAKIGRSEYLRSDGVSIRRHERVASWWQVFLPTGEQPQAWIEMEGRYSEAMACSAPSLTTAKIMAAHVTVDSPAYVPPSPR